jgi:hypothetical protein
MRSFIIQPEDAANFDSHQDNIKHFRQSGSPFHAAHELPFDVPIVVVISALDCHESNKGYRPVINT